jgi:phospholipid/cholesterol/gamma-HCH transport system permease protein
VGSATFEHLGASVKDHTVADALTVETRDGTLVVRLRGPWTLQTALSVDAAIRALADRAAASVTVDATSLSRLDSAGAWVIQRTVAQFESGGAKLVHGSGGIVPLRAA